MDKVEKELKNKDYKFQKNQFDSIKKSLKSEEKKHNQHAKYLAATAYLKNYEFNAADEELMFQKLTG